MTRVLTADPEGFTIYRTLHCVVAIAVTAFIAPAHSAERDAGWCEQEWLKHSATHVDREVPDYRSLLTSWQQYATPCSGTVAYEARLAIIYLYLDQTARAEEALRGVVSAKSEYRHLVETAQVLIDAKKRVRGKGVSERDLEELEHRFLDIVQKYPGHPEIYALLGAMESELGRHDAAVEFYKAALAGSPGMSQQWGVYRNLTISYADAGRYREAYDTAGATISRRKSVMSDKYFVYAVARAEAGLGKFADAQTALRVIAAKDSSVKADPDFLKTVDFVFEQMKKSAHAEH